MGLPRDTKILMTPGPVTVPKAVLREFSKPLIFHRYTDFQELYGTLINQLHHAFKASPQHKCVLFTGSGTAANEIVLSSVFDKNDKVLVVSNGDFGERLGTILTLHGVPINRYYLKPFQSIDAVQVVADAVAKNVTAIAMVAMETSTGMRNPIRDIGLLLRNQTRKPVAFFVDAVSALGCEPVDVKRWGITYCTSVPNKAIEAPPGISFACIDTSKYLRRRRTATSYYLDLSRYLDFSESLQSPTTPAVSQLAALTKALELLSNETLAMRRARYQALTDELIIKLEPMGFSPCVRLRKNRSSAVTAFRIPKHVAASEFNRFLRNEGFILWFPPSRKQSTKGLVNSGNEQIMLTSVMGGVTKSHVKGLVRTIKKFIDVND
jgi:2-aminoethylphosphonate-pyruvate transaminase